jgi:transketolase
MALEPLRAAMGRRFLNAGVAEQNMVGVAAGLARRGMRPWAYSIAPFLYARPFEQIRNDVCLPGLPVVLVGNGGGYGYGVMGATHHALEDYGVLLTLPQMRAYVPAFDADLEQIIRLLMRTDQPAYLRLGLAEQPAWLEPSPYTAWRRILAGNGPVVAAMGPLAGPAADAIRAAGIAADVWLVSELPLRQPPQEFLAGVKKAGYLMVVEEHVAQGGLGHALGHLLLEAGEAPRRFVHLSAQGYPSGLYGSQKFHRAESGLSPAAIVAELRKAAA